MPLDQAIRSAIAGMAARAKKKASDKTKASPEKSTGMGTKLHSKDTKKSGMHNHSCGGVADSSGEDNN